MSDAEHQIDKPIVITLHGIRTFAPWQKELADELSAADFETRSFDYGFFGALRVILPWKRKAQIKWFRDQYRDRVPVGRVPSIIAHSFGTYMIAGALENYDTIKFDQIILSGSIIPRDYDWQTLVDREQTRRVLNECGKQDIVVKVAPYVIADAGHSGAHGFERDNDEHFSQRTVSKFGHSDYLHRLNFRDNWIPYLQGGEPPKDRLPLSKTVNWRFRATIAALLIGFLLIAFLAAYAFGWIPWNTPNDPNKTTVLIAKFQSIGGQDRAVTDDLISQLRAITNGYGDVEIRGINESITEQEGSQFAREMCKEYGGDILLWGWYSVADESVKLIAYFEMLEPPKAVEIKNRREVHSERTVFEKHIIHGQLSGEMAYVVLLITGLARLSAEDYDGAIERFTNALQQPSLPAEKASRAYAYCYRGAAFYLKDDFDKAINDCRNAIELNPDYDAPHFYLGNAYYGKHDFDKAIINLTKAIEINPASVAAYINRGAAYDKKAEFDKAIADYDTVSRLNPSNVVAYFNCGNAYFNKGDIDNAIINYTKATELDSSYADAYYNRGNSYIKKREFDNAIADYNTVIRLNPSFAAAYNNLGIGYKNKREFDNAIINYTKAIKLNPSDADAYYNRGDAYRNKGEFDKAIADYGTTIEVNPSYAAAYYNRGYVHAKTGEIEKAIADCRKFSERADEELKSKQSFCEELLRQKK